MERKDKIKLVANLLLGFGIGLGIMAVAIYFGYRGAYEGSAPEACVKLLGLPIYQLHLVGKTYAGEGIGMNMGIVCAICMAVELVIYRILKKVRKH